MKDEIKSRWLAALRSGVYHQGQNRLHQGQQFCCLGVLCDIYINEHDVDWEEYKESGYSLYGESDFLPEQVCEWAGLGEADYPDVQLSVARLNDEGLTFGELADYIESSL